MAAAVTAFIARANDVCERVHQYQFLRSFVSVIMRINGGWDNNDFTFGLSVSASVSSETSVYIISVFTVLRADDNILCAVRRNESTNLYEPLEKKEWRCQSADLLDNKA